MPTASRSTVGALGKRLEIFITSTHRALDDARVTMAALNKLIELANELPLEMIAEIVRLSEPLDWDANWIFHETLRTKAKEGVKAKKIKK